MLQATSAKQRIYVISIFKILKFVSETPKEIKIKSKLCNEATRSPSKPDH